MNKKLTHRTLGWIQNPNNLNSLKMVVGLFVKDSPAYLWMLNERLPLLVNLSLIEQNDYQIIVNHLKNHPESESYALLKGRGIQQGGSRALALCSSIIQAAIDGQQKRTYTDKSNKKVIIKKPYTDDWSADGYLRWAIACGLLVYNNNDDSCSITELGKKLALSQDGSAEEAEFFTIALLHYPPVIRILSLLRDNSDQTKFDIGQQLGFKGELGFTSFERKVVAYDYSCAQDKVEKQKIKSNEEGDADKYARTICSWLAKMQWVDIKEKYFEEYYNNKKCSVKFQTYSITRKGEKALIKARGNSKHPRIARIVYYEMLASFKAKDADYLRSIRAKILQQLYYPKKLDKISQNLNAEDLTVSPSAVFDHIQGLRSIGLEISEKNGVYQLKDKIRYLIVPAKNPTLLDNIQIIKDRVREKLHFIDHDYLVLIDFAYSTSASKSIKNNDARLFEIKTANLLTKELNFSGLRLGDSNRPDVIISYKKQGVIIDNKAYSRGFTLDAHNRDEMNRYVGEALQRTPGVPKNEWWKNFKPEVSQYFFLFVTSFVKGDIKANLQSIHTLNQDKPYGAVIDVENLLYVSEGIKSHQLKYVDFFSLFKNEEIVYIIN